MLQLFSTAFMGLGPIRLYLIAALVLYVQAAFVHRLNLFFIFIMPGDLEVANRRADAVMFMLKWILVIVLLHYIWYLPYMMAVIFRIMPDSWDVTNSWAYDLANHPH
jgi:hypothetical protein